MRHLVILAVAVVFAISGQRVLSAPNVLLILADDMGVEALSVYGLGKSAPKTAALEAIAEEGVVFNNFWSQPVCSSASAVLAVAAWSAAWPQPWVYGSMLWLRVCRHRLSAPQARRPLSSGRGRAGTRSTD